MKVGITGGSGCTGVELPRPLPARDDVADVEGAAGQAVRNTNLMLGPPETAGPRQPALLP